MAAGAGAIHVHVRDEDGNESLLDADVANTIDAIRAACPGIPIGIGTGAWIIPDLRHRLAVIRSWRTLPDFASVNLHEAGAAEVIELLLERGVGVEAGIWNAPAAVSLIRSGLADSLSSDSAGTRRSVVQRARESAADGRRADRGQGRRGCCTGSDTARGTSSKWQPGDATTRALDSRIRSGFPMDRRRQATQSSCAPPVGSWREPQC